MKRAPMLVLIAVLLAGCSKPKQQLSGPAPVADATAPPDPADLEELPPGKVEASPDYARAAQRLLVDLRSAFPDADFGIAWNAHRLHISIHGVSYEAATETRLGDDGEPTNLAADVLTVCLAADAPPTKAFELSAKQEDGIWFTSPADWDQYEPGQMVFTPKPPEDLPRGHFSADSGYEAPAKALLAKLQKAYPDIDFAISWAPEMLHVTFYGSKTGWPEPDGSRGYTFTHPGIWGRIVRMAITTEAPPTKMLLMSEAESHGKEMGEWELYEAAHKAAADADEAD